MSFCGWVQSLACRHNPVMAVHFISVLCPACRPWLVKCSPAVKRPGPVPEIDAELWKLHNLWRERQQGEGRHQGECRDSVSSFER